MRIACSVGLAAAMAVGMMTQSVAAAGVGVATVKLCDARRMGAKADGVTKDTKAIQAAIDDCANAGGGTVRLIGGTFLTGPILLKSNITLEIEKGAVLLGSPDRADYPMVTFARNQTVQPLVSAVNAKNVAIVGEGTIDGNGKVWWDYIIGAKEAGVLGNDHPRPMGVVFDHTKHVRMEGVTVQNSGFWQIVPYYADDVTIRKIRVLAPKSPNTDAIDPFSSSNVVIDHVFASTGDDNVAIKSGAINSPGPDAPSRNITITDCNVRERPWDFDRQRDCGRRAECPRGEGQLQGDGPGNSHQVGARPRQRCVEYLVQGHHDGGCEDRDPDYRVLPAPCARG